MDVGDKNRLYITDLGEKTEKEKSLHYESSKFSFRFAATLNISTDVFVIG
jgi:hypothetical protein